MITLKQAIKIAEKVRNSKIVVANDCVDKWLFGFKDDQNKMDGIMLFVYKANGDIETILPTFLADLLLDGEITCTPIDLPKETP